MRAFAPGRVNLIGDHTDYLGGLVLPVATSMGTTVAGGYLEDRIRLESVDLGGRIELPTRLGAGDRPAMPPWGRFVEAVIAELFGGAAPHGVAGVIESDLPIGAGLSSSASLEVALALALGWEGSALELALGCRRAEERAVGVPCGIMDQVAVTAARAGHALMLDCAAIRWSHVPIPEGLEILVVDSGESRRLEGSAYAERRAAAEAAARRILGPEVEVVAGPFRGLEPTAALAAGDPVLVARARHHITENARVESMVAALEEGDLVEAGRLMSQSHRSLAEDYEVSTPVLDRLVADLEALPGVYGARLTGAGFGGCVVALTDRGAVDPHRFDRAWMIEPSAGGLA